MLILAVVQRLPGVRDVLQACNADDRPHDARCCWSLVILLFLALPILIVVIAVVLLGDLPDVPAAGVRCPLVPRLSRQQRMARGDLAQSGGRRLLSSCWRRCWARSQRLGLRASAACWRSIAGALIVSPLIVPVIVVAIGIYYAFSRYGLVGTPVGLVLAHTCLAVPFVVTSVGASLAGFDRRLEQAALSASARRRGARSAR